MNIDKLKKEADLLCHYQLALALVLALAGLCPSSEHATPEGL